MPRATLFNRKGGDGGPPGSGTPGGPGPDGTDPKPPILASTRAKVLAVVAVLVLLVALIALGLGGVPSGAPSSVKPLSDVLSAVGSGSYSGQAVRDAAIDDNNQVIALGLADGSTVTASYPANMGSDLVNRLQAQGIPFKTAPLSHPSPIGALLTLFLPVLLFIAFFWWLYRKGALGGTGGAKAFTATKAEVADVPVSRFSDVVGCDEAVEELSEVVTFLHDASRFEAAGARMPRGFLLVGPPGTGKTLLARAVAGEAGVPFYSAAGSDFTEMFVGVGAARVRDLFTKAKKTGGIVFIDELDSVGRARQGNSFPGGGANDERESTLNALLVEMDGFGKQDNVVVVAATNRHDVLDPALLRAGRFDRQVTVAPPDRRGRTRLLELYATDRNIDPDVDFVSLARRTPGLTGADIANLVNQAALEAARASREVIVGGDFDEALATVMMGRARKSAIVTERDREVTAWHEAGHTVAALTLADANDPVQVTIVPRGVAGGVTWMGGDDDSFLTRSQARAQLIVALGGRAAEELLLDGDFTQGASGDLASATNLALNMVTRWGMSPLGLAALSPEHVGFGGLPERVHSEVDTMLADALASARVVLAGHRALFDAVVAELLLEDTIDVDRLRSIQARLEGGPVAPATGPADPMVHSPAA